MCLEREPGWLLKPSLKTMAQLGVPDSGPGALPPYARPRAMDFVSSSP